MITIIDTTNTNPQFLDLSVRALVARGESVRVFANERQGFPRVSSACWTPFNVREIAKPSIEVGVLKKIGFVISYVIGWSKVLVKLKSYRSSAVLVTTSFRLRLVDWLFFKILSLLGIRRFLLIHRPYYGDNSDRPISRWIVGMLESSSAIFVISKHVEDICTAACAPGRVPLFVRVPHPHYQMILDEVPVDAVLSSEIKSWLRGRHLILFISKLIDSHGPKLMLDAFKSLSEKRDDVCLMYLGNDHCNGTSELARGIRADVQERDDVMMRIGFYSFSEARAAFACTSVVCLPYIEIPQSGVIPMVVGQGLPVVVTDVGGLPEMVLPQVSGVVCKRDAESISNGIAEVLDALPRFQAGAREASEQLFDPAVFAERVSQAFAN